jgi:hypothetical protein
MMIGVLLPKDDPRTTTPADALAIAVCHAIIGEVLPGWRRDDRGSARHRRFQATIL